MGANELPGLPGGMPTQQHVVVSKVIEFSNVVLLDPEPNEAGGMTVQILVPQTGELYRLPLRQDATEKLGKQLVAPRVALPGNGLHAV